MPQDDTTRIAFRVVDLMKRAGVSAQNPNAVVTRVEQLLAGGEPEDEFVTFAIWSQRCALIHRLEQDQYPLTSKQRIQVPDLLLVAKLGESQLPLLVEVKNKVDDTLVFSEKYYCALCEYSRILKLPLVIAWRWNTFWTVVDIEAFERKVHAYHLSLERAAKLNLLGKLMGDFGFMLSDNWELRIRMKKLTLLDDEARRDSIDQKWELRIENVKLVAPDEVSAVSGPLFWAALSCTLDESIDESAEYFDLHLKPRKKELIPAGRVPLAALSFDRSPFTKPIDFISVARGEALPFSLDDLRASIMNGGHVIDQVWDIRPQKYPRWWPLASLGNGSAKRDRIQ